MRDAVLKSMGPSYVLDEFMMIAELGLGDWPKTLLGKIQKTKLAALVYASIEKLDARENRRAVIHL
jgi:hypothetical protein